MRQVAGEVGRCAKGTAISVVDRRLALVAGAGAMFCCGTVAFATQQYMTIDLGPVYPELSNALGSGGDQQVGFELGSSRYATLWTGTAASAVNLNPAGYTGSLAYATDGATEVGIAYGPATNSYAQAAIWKGTAGSFENLNPSGDIASQANAVDGNLVGGQGTSSAGVNHVLLWNTSSSTVTDLNPAGATSSDVYAVSGGEEGGVVQMGGGNQATLWKGTAQSGVNLTPAGSTAANLYGMSGNEEVGDYGLGARAILWYGSAQDYVDLNGSLDGSIAYATNGIQQVGEGNPVINGIGQGYHAMVWSGSSSSYEDLSVFLPSAFANSTSVAMGIDAAGDIFGTADYTYGEDQGQAFLWVPIPEPVSGVTVVALAGVYAVRRRPRFKTTG